MNKLLLLLVNLHHKVLIIILLAIASSFWFYAMMSSSDIDFAENVVRIVRESDRRENKNSIPLRQSHSRNSFTARVKREATKAGKIAAEPTVEMTKSSQQIQFTPELGYFYGTAGSMDSYQMTSSPPFFPMQLAYGNAFTPGYLPFQPNGQIACFLNPEQAPNPYALFYCTYIPARAPPVTYQFPAMPGIPDFNMVGRQNDDDSTDSANTKLNPYEHLLQEYVRECPPNNFRCNDGSKCIQKYEWCDNKVDCPDGSDEKKCTCRDRLSSHRICDNYLDCPNGEDELGCYGCPKTAMSCHDSVDKYSRCFKLTDRCDGIQTCDNGKDEEDCEVLSNDSAHQLGVFPAGHFNGFLHRNYKGKWYHVCGYAPAWAWQACLSRLGHMSVRPAEELVMSKKHAEFGPFLDQNGLLSDECPQSILYVKCPDPSGARRNKFNQKTLVAITNSTSGPLLGIVGGRPSAAGAWPFVVAINKNGRFTCGGAVVSAYWILSAAHCFFGAQRNYYEIEAGTLRRHSFSPAHQIRRVRSVFTHSQFDAQQLSYDIALVRLDEPLYFNDYVDAVTLPRPMSFSGWNMEPSPGATCVAVGWGAIVEGGPDPDHLQEVSMPIVECRHSQDRNPAEICAGYKQGGRDACQGDSGGPLMCRNSYGEWYIGGVVSHGIGCARVNEPGAYTKVSYFVSWINDVISGRTTSSIEQRPLDKCPGFSCRRPFHRCLSAKKRCDGVVNCLEAEDEVNCPPTSLIETAANFIKGIFRETRQHKLPEV